MLLKLRKRELDALSVELAKARARITEIELEIHALNEALAAERAHSSGAATAADHLSDFGIYLARVRSAEAALIERREAAEAEADAIHAQVADAFRALKSLEIARDREMAMKKQKADLRAQVELDEIALRKAFAD